MIFRYTEMKNGLETIKKQQYFGYILSITIVTFSITTLDSTALYYYPPDLDILFDLVPPGSRIIGTLLAMWVMKWGRRRILLITDCLLILLAYLECFNDAFWYRCLVVIAVQIIHGFAMAAVLLYTKEIPAFLTTGYPLCFAFAFMLLGSLASNVWEYVISVYYSMDISSPGLLYLRLLLSSIFIIPCLLQLALLLAVFKHEPLQYYVDTESPDYAMIAAHQMYKDPDASLLNVNILIEKHETHKYRGYSLKELCTYRTLKQIILSGGLLFLSYSVGYITYQFAEYYLKERQVWVFQDICYAYYSLWLLASPLYINCLPLWLNQGLGFGLALLMHLATLCLFVVEGSFGVSLVYFVLSVLCSLPTYALTLVSSFKFVLILFGDRWICLTLCIYHSATLLFIFDLIKPRCNATLALLIALLFGSALGLGLALTYSRKYEPLVKKRRSMSFASQDASDFNPH